MGLYSTPSGHKCPVCGHIERVSKRAVSQLDPVIAGDMAPLDCPDCGRPCASVAGLAAHQRSHKAVSVDA